MWGVLRKTDAILSLESKEAEFETMCADGDAAIEGESWLYHDYTHEAVDPVVVRAARADVMVDFVNFDIYEHVPREVATEWLQAQQAITLGARWVDRNKGTLEKPKFRSRLVAMEFANKDRDGLCTAVPPLSAFK